MASGMIKPYSPPVSGAFKPFELVLFQPPPAFESRVLGRLFWFPTRAGFSVCCGFVCPSAALPKPSPAMWPGIHALVGVLSFNFHASFIACCGDFIK